MTILDPASLPPEHVADLSASGERVDLCPPCKRCCGQSSISWKPDRRLLCFPALADQDAIKRMQALDELAREAYALGLYDRNLPAESNSR